MINLIKFNNIEKIKYQYINNIINDNSIFNYIIVNYYKDNYKYFSLLGILKGENKLLRFLNYIETYKNKNEEELLILKGLIVLLLKDLNLIYDYKIKIFKLKLLNKIKNDSSYKFVYLAFFKNYKIQTLKYSKFSYFKNIKKVEENRIILGNKLEQIKKFII